MHYEQQGNQITTETTLGTHTEPNFTLKTKHTSLKLLVPINLLDILLLLVGEQNLSQLFLCSK